MNYQNYKGKKPFEKSKEYRDIFYIPDKNSYGIVPEEVKESAREDQLFKALEYINYDISRAAIKIRSAVPVKGKDDYSYQHYILAHLSNKILARLEEMRNKKPESDANTSGLILT
ncbi:MAG: hypothetical protein HXX08_05380 [Chloroflexi bacterium]|uniref:Uncharacterized protein n=1 Tax=Candidatus Chlorohelix allophototropha TaxID=3003348 RepID=A0A8T7LWF7_9CHLR|nr:hypothetical protein [Chloroflexota bacterium]WJW67168.1 hypothetical protein OZ401_000424 [Chloroflexota bacterium L227-S17]